VHIVFSKASEAKGCGGGGATGVPTGNKYYVSCKHREMKYECGWGGITGQKSGENTKQSSCVEDQRKLTVIALTTVCERISPPIAVKLVWNTKLST